MATSRHSIAIVASSALLTIGLTGALQPPREDLRERRTHGLERQVEQASEAQEREHQRYRVEGETHGEAEMRHALEPAEYRAFVEPRPRVRILP